jgi:putative oxidoreductase
MLTVYPFPDTMVKRQAVHAGRYVMIDFVTHKTLAPLVLRLGLAVIFVFHGLQKVHPDAGWGTNWHPNLSFALQIPVAYGELLGGIALAFGFLTRLAALGIAGIMAGAIATVHGPNGFSLAAGGFEYNFALIMMCVPLMLTGGGLISLDKLLFGLLFPRKKAAPPTTPALGRPVPGPSRSK